MKHLQKGRKFHRKKGQRRMFLRNLMVNLALEKKIETTETRAKEIRGKMEKMITLGKKQNLPSLRLLISRLGKKAAFEIYNNISPKFKERPGGYLRIIKSPYLRKRDSSKTALIEFVE
jgi:large subunit ribosomal protein L17